jgi:hypothetical protein
MNFNYDLSCINNKKQLLRFLGIDEQPFDAILNFKPLDPSGVADSSANVIAEPFFIIRHEIPKKNPARGVRIVWEALDPLNDIYKALSRRLNLFFQHKLERFPHPNVFGYVPGRNIRENASEHIGKRYLTQVDIKDFFSSIMAAESQCAFLHFEENDKVSRQKIRDVVHSAFTTLKQQNNRRPRGCEVRFVTKSTLGVSIPDFLLGVFRRYMTSGRHTDGSPNRREHMLFERLRDKCRVIIDVDSGAEYSRRTPIKPW